ncbi:sensor domain-containing diguanylate cyclase [Massilia sp. MS-15]|uniref:sensor domain-containing diguanylate cyclase n=1 Tax=Massilia sp. MS-15 TaxID=2878200 RepID=UPI001CD67CF5|nr:sensor domain-containing diguanylate cyclase [Massilia sp. MS-15]MCA1245958.1 sensor domain-containing diguanylate cyclase [Massilia sp. MS-15]
MPNSQSPLTPILRLTAEKRPAVTYAIWLLVLFGVLLVGAQAWSAWSARQSRLAEHAAATSNMAGALASQAESTVRIVDTVLAGVVERVEHDGMTPAAADRLHSHVRNMVGEVRQLHGLFVYGADGSWLVTSLERPVAGNNADREYFQYHRNNPGRGVHIGKPVRSRSSGVWVLPVSRRVDRPDGSFGGVALGTIRIAFFADLYGSFDVGKDGVIFLARDDGTLLYRRPFTDSLVGTDVRDGPVFQMVRRSGPVGTAMLRSKIDGVVRLYSYRHLDKLPLIVATAQSKQDILEEWQQSSLLMSGVTLLVVLLLVGVGTRLVRQIMIRDELDAELRIAKADLQERNRELTVLATNDGLTGIANRRHFEDTLRLELKRARRTGVALSLLLFDVDFFKKYNDRYGHVAGDDCLRQVAATLQAKLARPTDLAARYGGEEFAVILPATGQVGARYVAERLRLALMDLGIVHADNPYGVATLSGGACTYHGTHGEEVDPDTFVRRADALLYRAKANGRNRICSDLDSSSLPAQPSLAI